MSYLARVTARYSKNTPQVWALKIAPLTILQSGTPPFLFLPIISTKTESEDSDKQNLILRLSSSLGNVRKKTLQLNLSIHEENNAGIPFFRKTHSLKADFPIGSVLFSTNLRDDKRFRNSVLYPQIEIATSKDTDTISLDFTFKKISATPSRFSCSIDDILLLAFLVYGRSSLYDW
jgi:hypothetical protein